MQYAVDNRCLYLRLEGSLRHSAASTLDAFLGSIFKGQPLDMAVIDLTRTVFLDSTTLGVLASVAIRLRTTSRLRPLIATGSEDISILLASMGFEQYFEIVDDSATLDAPRYCGIDLARLAPAALRGMTLQAHKNLAEMNARNREAFQEVITLLEKGNV